jgi:ribokinase
MPADPRVLVVGSLHLDVIVHAPQLPRPDQTVTGTSVSYAFGGKGGNQAVAAARMGAQVTMAGAVGRDAFGETLLQALRDAGVAHGGVQRIAGASGMSVATVLPDGSYGAVIVSGANLQIDGQAVVFPQGCKALILQNEIPAAANLVLAERAKSLGIPVVLNAAPARPMPAELLRLLDLLVVNRGEAADLLGVAETSLDAASAARSLCLMGPTATIVTLGKDGIAAQAETAFAEPAYPVRPVSSHGAGDAFLGALVAEWAGGATLRDACRFGQAAAALHVATEVENRAAITPNAVRALIGQSR